MASVSFDIYNITKKLDTLDAKGPTDRNIQSAFYMGQTIASMLLAIKAGGASNYTLSEAWTEATRATYETAVDDAFTAQKNANTQLKALIKL